MTWNNPNPLANPLNSQKYTNFNVDRADNGFYINKGSSNPKDLQVPNQDVPMYGTPEWEAKYNRQTSLTVPNQDIPLGDQLRGNGFLPGSDCLFRLADGTIINFRTGKIVRQGSNSNSGQYWGNPNRTIEFGVSQAYEHPKDEFSSIIAKANSLGGPIEMQTDLERLEAEEGPLDQQSIQYWLKAQEEADKMKANMTQQQLDAIKQFEQHFPKSKLIEESKKFKESSII